MRSPYPRALSRLAPALLLASNALAGCDAIRRANAWVPAPGENLGRSVALELPWLLTGAPGATAGGVPLSGRADLFSWNGSDFGHLTELVASNAARGDLFGYSVCLSGDVLVVGAPETDRGGFSQSGSAYVFERLGGLWTETQELVAPAPTSGALFGTAVACDGDVVVVGAPGAAVGALVAAGEAHVFRRSGATFVHEARLVASDAAPSDQLGASVAASGARVAVGAPLADHSGGSEAGAVYLFSFLASAWTPEAKLVSSAADPGDAFGASVALRGELLVAGAPNHSLPGRPGHGDALIFSRSSGAWSEERRLGPLAGGTYQGFGRSVAASAELVVVGAPDTDLGANLDVGGLDVFARSATGWELHAALLGAAAESLDRIGASVAADDDLVVGGAPGDAVLGERSAGSARPFRCNLPPECSAGPTLSGSCAGTPVTGATASDRNDDILAYRWSSSCADVTFDPGPDVLLPTVLTGPGCARTCMLSLTVDDGRGGSCTSTTTLEVRDTLPPTLVGLPDELTLECADVPPAPTVTASDDCDPAPVLLSCEARAEGGCRRVIERSWTAIDACGNATSATRRVTVHDTTAPEVEPGSAGRRCLWSPDHAMACLTAGELAPEIRDGCGGAVTWRIASCVSDQPDDGTGDGSTSGDCVVSADGLAACVRSERSGSSAAGRTYTLAVIATDACGNASPPVPVATVSVSHDRRAHEDCRRAR